MINGNGGSIKDETMPNALLNTLSTLETMFNGESKYNVHDRIEYLQYFEYFDGIKS